MTNTFEAINNFNSNKKDTILKEYELLQNVISRQEEIRIQSRNWFITLITALTVALFTKENILSNLEYITVCLLLTPAFLYIELIHRVAEQRAIERSKDVESALRNEVLYNGPYINESLTKDNSLLEQFKGFNIRVYSTYLLIAIVVISIYFIKRPS